MRWVFLLLLLLNVGLFVWQHRLAPSAGGELSLSMRTPAAVVAPAQSLRLLAEAQQAAATAGMAGTGGGTCCAMAAAGAMAAVVSKKAAISVRKATSSIRIGVPLG